MSVTAKHDDIGERCEHLVSEDTIVPLHQLCGTCSRFVTSSALLQRWSRSTKIRIGTIEFVPLGSPAQLKSGYLSGCHLCALVWNRLGGHLFNPAKPTLHETETIIELKATNPSKTYRITYEGSKIQRLRYKIAPPFMYSTV